MQDIFTLWRDTLIAPKTFEILKACFLFTLGYLLARPISIGFVKLFGRQLSAQHQMLMRRIVFYLIIALVLVSSLHEAGFKLSVLLGAAGVLSVGIGFASQTSASNLISGLFLIAERPFVLGDVIEVGGTTGEVLSIDLMSVKLRTYDHLYVRVPNETLIKSPIINHTHYPINRIDLFMNISYKEDISKVRQVLMDVASHNPLCLEEPKPLFIVQQFGEYAIRIQFSVWVIKQNRIELKNSIQEEIKRAYELEGIRIPMPQREVTSTINSGID